MMEFRKEKGIAPCGLACTVCREEACPGCEARGCAEHNTCEILRCTMEKRIAGCYACEDFPCDAKMLQSSHRLRAFGRYAKQHGVDGLMAALERNHADGIVYHRGDGLAGDYDAAPTERAVMAMLAFGRASDPYKVCPSFETEHFAVRLVRETDARDLLACYGDERAWPVFNADNCTSDFRYTTLEEMEECVRFFVEAQANGWFVRWSIVDKATGRAVGTIEMFGGEGETGVLRLDTASAYEKEAYLRELIGLSVDSFFLLFGVETMLVKAPPASPARQKVVEALGFAPVDIPDRPYTYARQA